MKHAKPIGAVVAVLVVTASVLPVAAVGAGTASTSDQADANAYQGSHVGFVAQGDAMTNYTVDGEEMVADVKVESEEGYRSRTGLGIDVGLGLSSVTELQAAAVGLSAQSETGATVRTESGAEMRAHDNGHGILVVAAGNGSQVVKANLSSDASAEAEGDSRVVVTNENGTKGTFVVVGEGDVAVNGEGDVTARLEEDSRLVFRSYPEGRDEADEKQEELIAEGEAAAEVYVMAESEGEGTVTDTVRYDENTTVETRQRAEGTVEMTVNRTEHDGKVIIASVSEAAVGSTEDLSVSVDGEAAARASSYSELKSATNDGSQSKFMVVQGTSAEASADVLVAVNHFSTRTVTMSGDGSGDGTTDGSDGTTDGSDGTGDDGTGESTGADDNDADGSNGGGQGLPGFGPAVAVLALMILGVGAAVRRRI